MLTARLRTFVQDCFQESGEDDGYRLPDHVVPLGGLDQLKMMAPWTATRGKADALQRARYCEADYNGRIGAITSLLP
jgi:hypothetical protein